MDYLPIKIFNFVNLDAVFTNHFEYPAIILNFKGGGGVSSTSFEL